MKKCINPYDNQNYRHNNNNIFKKSPNRNVESFTESIVANTASIINKSRSGPLLEDGAIFSAIGVTELRLTHHIGPK